MHKLKENDIILKQLHLFQTKLLQTGICKVCGDGLSYLQFASHQAYIVIMSVSQVNAYHTQKMIVMRQNSNVFTKITTMQIYLIRHTDATHQGASYLTPASPC
jgi:uncharacterized protein (DUF983 family)